MQIISLTAENVKKLRAPPQNLPPQQIAMLRFVAAGAVRYAHHSGGLVSVQGDVMTSKAKPVLRALERKGLVCMPGVSRGVSGGLVTITSAGRKSLEQVDTTGRVGIVIEDGAVASTVAA